MCTQWELISSYWVLFEWFPLIWDVISPHSLLSVPGILLNARQGRSSCNHIQLAHLAWPPPFLYYVKHRVLRVNTNGVNVRFVFVHTHMNACMCDCACMCSCPLCRCHLDWLPVILFCFLYSNRVSNKQISIHILQREGLDFLKMIQDVFEDFSIFKFVDWEILENFPSVKAEP